MELRRRRFATHPALRAGAQFRHAGAILWLGAAACQPTIAYFRAQPNVICKGSPTVLAWSASAGGQIVDEQAGTSVVTSGGSGTASLSPSRPTTYRLDATSAFGTTSREANVEVLQAGAPVELGASAADPTVRCAGATLTVVADAKAESWDAHLLAGTVTALGHRALHVEHDGTQADLPADGSTDVFKAVTVRGRWTLATPLGPGEGCGVRVPRNLAIRVSPSCSP